MLNLIKKIQQEYIAAKLKDHRAHWAKTEDSILLTLDDVTLYSIPNKALHIALQGAEENPGLPGLIKKEDGYRPGEYKGTTCDGFAVFKADGLTVIADPKKVKPFLGLKGMRLKIQSEKTAIRFYDASGKFVGAVWPKMQQAGRNYEL